MAKPTNDGGGDPKTVSKLTPQQMMDWNRLLDHIKSRGYEGSPVLDHDKALSQQLFQEFAQKNPGTSITYQNVADVQNEMQRLKDAAQGFAQRRGDKGAAAIMSNVSKVDGFLGSKTSQFRFPNMEEKNFHNNVLRGTSNLGLVNGNLQPTGALAAMKQIPKGAQTWQSNDGGTYYTDPKSGDAVRLK
jgi:hypothetical protein